MFRDNTTCVTALDLFCYGHLVLVLSTFAQNTSLKKSHPTSLKQKSNRKNSYRLNRTKAIKGRINKHVLLFLKVVLRLKDENIIRKNKHENNNEQIYNPAAVLYVSVPSYEPVLVVLVYLCMS